MNPIRLLVLLAATLFAGPFHVGASWEWRIFDPSGKEVGYRVARVVDSVDRPEEHRVRWTIQVEDSASSLRPISQDLYEEFDSISGALRSRGWYGVPHVRFPLPIGPMSLDGIKATFKNIPSPGFGLPCKVYGDSVPGYLMYRCGKGAGGLGASLPIPDWDDSIGWSHLRVPDMEGFSQFREWMLVKRNGVAIQAHEMEFLLPQKGDVWIWERNEVRSSVVWKSFDIADAQIDSIESLQFVHIMIDKVDKDSHGTVRVYARKVVVDSAIEPESLFVQWRPDSRPNSNDLDCDDVLDGFRWDWIDHKSENSRIRYDQYHSSNTMLDSWGKTRFVRLRSIGGVDSLQCNEFGTRSGAWRPSETYTTVTYRLLSVNDSVVRAPAWTGVRSRMGAAKVPFDLREFAKAHPDALVKIVGADGRQRTRMARELFGLGSGSSLRVGWFEVRLPDGSVQRGSFTR